MARFPSRRHGHGVASAPSVVSSAQARSALLQGEAPRDRGRFAFTDAADAGSSVSLTDVLDTLDRAGPPQLEALPLKLEFCHTRLAAGQDAAWMRRFRSACAALDTAVEAAGRLIISWR
jgi:hypothetical protein